MTEPLQTFRDFNDRWLSFDDMNILIDWTITEIDGIKALRAIIYQPKKTHIVEEYCTITEPDFIFWKKHVSIYPMFELLHCSDWYIDDFSVNYEW